MTAMEWWPYADEDVEGDVLEPRDGAPRVSEAAMRTSPVAVYFWVDNRIAGKRKQLGFILATLATDDPELASWARGEMQVVDAHLVDLEAEQKKVQTEIEPSVSVVATREAAARRLDDIRAWATPGPPTDLSAQEKADMRRCRSERAFRVREPDLYEHLLFGSKREDERKHRPNDD